MCGNFSAANVGRTDETFTFLKSWGYVKDTNERKEIPGIVAGCIANAFRNAATNARYGDLALVMHLAAISFGGYETAYDDFEQTG